MEAMRRSHDSFVKTVKNLALRLPYWTNLQGIVMATRKDHVHGALISLVMPRCTGFKLPMHLFLEPGEDSDYEICEGMLTEMDVEYLTQ